MLKLLFNQLVFLLILAAQLFAKNKYDKKTYESKFSYLFVLLYILLFWWELKYSYAIIYGEVFAINISLFFILGFILSVKQCISVSVLSIILILFFKHLYGEYLISLYVDIIVCILNMFFGKFCNSIVHKNSPLHIIYSITYAIILASIYAIIALIAYAIKDENGSYVYNFLPIEFIFRILMDTVVIASSFFVFNIFDKSHKGTDNNLLSIFIKKYNKLIIGFLVFATIFTYILLFLYVNGAYARVLEFNFGMAKKELMTSYSTYGDKCLEKDPGTKDVFDSWTLELAGGIYVFDKEFNAINTFDILDADDFVSEEELAAENFKDIVRYPKNKILNYKSNGHWYKIVYDEMVGYYLVGFFSFKKLIEYAIPPICFSIFIIILNVLAVFVLIYKLFKDFILSRLWNVNEKLKRITSGDYDVLLSDDSSEEFSNLSKNINKTVDALKSNIDELAEKNKEEMVLARRIQASQLPNNTDVTIAHSGYGINIPAEDVGGDFYDSFTIDDVRKLVLVADVSGKGIPGALFMMKAKNTIKNLATQYDSMEVIFDETNKILSENNPTLMFVTCFAIMIDLSNGKISMINAGHNRPIIARHDGTCEFIDMKPSHILGIDKTSKYLSKEMELSAGDRIILYTDGVNEANNVKKEQYGNERFLESVRNIKTSDPKNTCFEIVDDIKKFAGFEPQSDDITIYVLRYNGKKNSIKLHADYDAIDKVKAFIDKFVKIYDVDTNVGRNLKVVFDETASNIIKYAYDGENGDFTFEINLVDNDTVEMVFIDSGKEFDPTKYDNNNIKRGIEDKINGGMGIMFCKSMMDKCVYDRVDGQNVLKMYKKTA